MAKINSETRITDNKGIAAVATYCANHNPAMSWKPIPIDDIGIDGQIELFDKSNQAIGEILYIQLKSTERDNSYIKNEHLVNQTFTFYAEKEHVDYWQAIPNDVLLIIYDNRNGINTLYAKKIENIDTNSMGTKSVPIQFNKIDDVLDIAKNNFLQKFSRLYNKTNPKIKTQSLGSEKLKSNLIKLNFPAKKIFVASIIYDREDVIKKSWETKIKLKLDATDREVAINALLQKDLRFSSDWTIYNKKIFTFHNLNDNQLPISKIIDKSSIDIIDYDDFYQINEEYKNVFKSLIRQCLKQVLYKKGFEWDDEDRIFKAKLPEVHKIEINKLFASKYSNNELDYVGQTMHYKEKWKGDKEARRTVVKSNYWSKGKIYYCTHFCLELDVKEFEDNFYICINPTWLVTVNGKGKSKVGYKKVSQIKKLERNLSVYNHTRFVSYKLIYTDLFSIFYSFITFTHLINFEINKVFDEKLWLQKEEEEEQTLMQDDEDPNDIDHEN